MASAPPPRLPRASFSTAGVCSFDCLCKTEPDHDAYAYLITRRVLLLSLLATVLAALSLAPSQAYASGTPTGWSEASYFTVRHNDPGNTFLFTDTCALFSDLFEVKVGCTRVLQGTGQPPPTPLISPVPGACVGCTVPNSTARPLALSWFQLYLERGCGASDTLGVSNTKGCTGITTLLNIAAAIHVLITFALLSLMGHLATQGEALLRMWSVRGGAEFVVGAGLKARLPLGTMARLRPAGAWRWLAAPFLLTFATVIAWPSAVTVSLLFLRDDLSSDATAMAGGAVMRKPSLGVRPGGAWYLQFFALCLLGAALVQANGLEVRLRGAGLAGTVAPGNALEHAAALPPAAEAAAAGAQQPLFTASGAPAAKAAAAAPLGAAAAAAPAGSAAPQVVVMNPFQQTAGAAPPPLHVPPPPPLPPAAQTI